MNKIRTAIIGFGLSGSVFHAPYISNSENYLLSAICSSREPDIRKQYPDVRVVACPEQIFNDPGIDLVIIATPTHLHYPQAQAALLAGKHVVVEKPFTVTAEEGMKLAALAAERRLVLSVYQNRRYDNDYIALRRCLNENLLGKIYAAEFRFDRYRPQAAQRWKELDIPGAGCLYDIAPHMIDHSLALFGLPDTIYAELACQRAGAVVPDWLHILLGYDKPNPENHNGANLRVNLHFSNFACHSGPRMLVYGETGTFIKYGMDPQERLQPLFNSGISRDNLPEVNACLDNIIELHRFENGRKEMQQIHLPYGNYSGYYDDLYQSITSHAPPPVSATEGANVIRIIELAQQSAKTGQRITIA